MNLVDGQGYLYFILGNFYDIPMWDVSFSEVGDIVLYLIK